MKPFLSFQGSRACFFSGLFTGESCPLRIPFDRPPGHEPFGRERRVERLRAMSNVEWLRAAVSPIPKSRKQRRPPASHSRNDFMVSPLGRIGRVCAATILLIRRVPHLVSLMRNERLPAGSRQRMCRLRDTEYTGRCP